MADKTKDKTESPDLASIEAAVQAAADKADAERLGIEGEAPDFKREGLQGAGEKSKAAARKASQAIGAVTGEMFKALRAPDPSTRRMAMLFFLGLAGVAAVSTLAYRRYSHIQDLRSLKGEEVQETSKNLGEFIQKQAEHAKKKFATLSIGKFTVDLRAVDGSKPRRGVLNMAELEITVECDDKDTRYYIEENLPRARDQITGILTSLDRDDMLTRDGKKKLKKKLIDQLNMWLPKGKVEELFISNQLLN